MPPGVGGSGWLLAGGLWLVVGGWLSGLITASCLFGADICHKMYKQLNGRSVYLQCKVLYFIFFHTNTAILHFLLFFHVFYVWEKKPCCFLKTSEIREKVVE